MVLDVMVDLETMSTAAHAAFVQLGAVAFDPCGTTLPSVDQPSFVFYRNVDLASCIDLGLHVDGGTVMWWLQRSEEARASLLNPSPEPVRNVLADFAQWFMKVTARDSYIWSHGLTFDVPILAEAYRRLGRKTPWFFSRAHDTRTIFDRAGFKLPSADTRVGGHNALQDALVQAAGVQTVWAPRPVTLASTGGSAGGKPLAEEITW